MTREEAIEELKEFKDKSWDGMPEEVIDIAISALEMQPLIEKFQELDDAEKLARLLAMVQEPICDRDCEHCTWTECPIEPCDDAVSREALKNMLISLDKWHVKNKQFVNVGLLYDDVFFGIEQLPPVTPSRHKGHWNEYYTSQKGNDVFNCKECGHTFIVMQGQDDMNFCPNCGAEMESKE